MVARLPRLQLTPSLVAARRPSVAGSPSSPSPPCFTMSTSYVLTKNREDTFIRPPTKKSRGSTHPSRAASRNPTSSWPHPPKFVATPESLAIAGFWFDPSSSSPDRVTCYYCKKSLGGWEPDDDPYTEHARRNADGECPWAMVVCAVLKEKEIFKRSS